MTRIYTRSDPMVRFMEKVAVTPTGCWRWTAALKSTGYGQFFVEKVDGRSIWASARVGW